MINSNFNFDCYPELLKAYKIWEKINNKHFKLSIKSNADTTNIYNKINEYTNAFAQQIFDAFNGKIKFVYHETRGEVDAWGKSIEDAANFDETIYAETIYNVFKEIKPALRYFRTGENHDWDEIFEGKEFKDLNSKQRKTLYMMIDYERPYRLPDEYYDERDKFEEIKKGTY